MKTLKVITLLATLALTSCAASGRGSKNNLIASLFTSGSSLASESSITTSVSDNYSYSSDGPVYSKIDVDLTTMNSTMIYSQVLNFFESPSEYYHKIIKMKGPFNTYVDGGNVYPAIIIPDATACCATGIEFLLYGVPLCTSNGGNGYPALKEEAIIVGRFEKYLEGGSLYVHLVDSVWVK